MKIEIKRLGVALLLPILILFVLFSASYAQTNTQINVSVIVFPNATVDCKPDTLTVGSGVEWIYCFIELEGADVHDVDPANVGLTVVGKPGLVAADASFKYFGDFDADNITDIMLRFSRASADYNWFHGITQPTTFTFDLLGSVRGFPFNGTDPILVVKSFYSFAQYMQIDSVDLNGGKINWMYGPTWFDYRNYTPTYLHFTGYFYSIGDPKIFGISEFHSEGYLRVEKTYQLLIFDLKVIEKQPVTISAIVRNYDDCNVDTQTKEVYCKGPGTLLISKDRTGQLYSVDLDNFIINIKNYKAGIEGGKIWNELFKVSNITITNIYVS
jgi:hypothetical protein